MIKIKMQIDLNKSMVNIHHVNTNQNKCEVFLLVSGKVNFRTTTTKSYQG